MFIDIVISIVSKTSDQEEKKTLLFIFVLLFLWSDLVEKGTILQRMVTQTLGFGKFELVFIDCKKK